MRSVGPGLAVAGVFGVVVQTTVAYAASISPPAERGRDLGVVTSGATIDEGNPTASAFNAALGETGKIISAEKYVPTTWASKVDLATGLPDGDPDKRPGPGHPG